MGPIATLFPNPAVKILEQRLWEAAQKRYLSDHPGDTNADVGATMRNVRSEYKDTVAATLRDADRKVRAKWGEFKHAMTKELRSALTTVFRMSELDWYAVEIGRLLSPDVIAVPYELLKQMTVSLLTQALRKGIDFENLDDQALEALAIYAAQEKFEEVLENVRHHRELLEIGSQRALFVIAEIINADPYFLDEETHHSLIETVILGNASAGESRGHKNNAKAAVKRWFQLQRENRKNDRRFTGDGWEIQFQQLKSWTTKG